MPRSPRDDAPGVAHHVMVRGIERRPIFRDDADRAELLRRLSLLGPALGFRCFAWALMPNHFHLVVRSGATRVSRLMARLGTGYARYFNARHERAGHLFQNRFRSRRVLDDTDLMGLVLYVCRNPLEAELVTGPGALECFPWCGASALLGRRPPHAFEAIDETLALFDGDLGRARCRLRSWLEEPAGAASHEVAAGVPRPTKRAVPADRRIGEWMQELRARFGVSEAELRSRRRGRAITAARAALASHAARELGLSGSELARALGLTPSGVSRLLGRTQRVN